MAKAIKIKKGLDIPMIGQAKEALLQCSLGELYGFVPDDFVGLYPKVLVKPGEIVQVGTPLMCDKNRPEIVVVSSVSGEVQSVNRGAKRKVLSIVVKSDGKLSAVSLPQFDLKKMSGEEVKQTLLAYGFWPFISQRPYDIIATPTDQPTNIFVTGFDSAPLAPNSDFMLAAEGDALQAGLVALSKMTQGKLYVGVRSKSKMELVAAVEGTELIFVDGPHPAGNVGVQINAVAPVNKGEVVWTLRAADVVMMGRLFANGTLDFSRTIALTGEEATECGYIKTIVGATIESLTKGKIAEGKSLRIISGNVLTGKKVTMDEFLGATHTQVTVIAEGDDVHEFLGWGTPGLNKFSAGRTYLAWLFGKKRWHFDARIRGGKRAMILSNEYDRVFPMDILPEYLLKAIISFNIDKMEALGIYEVAPEDFALCEFVDTSKIEIQKIVREGLDKLYKEMM